MLVFFLGGCGGFFGGVGVGCRSETREGAGCHFLTTPRSTETKGVVDCLEREPPGFKFKKWSPESGGGGVWVTRKPVKAIGCGPKVSQGGCPF